MHNYFLTRLAFQLGLVPACSSPTLGLTTLYWDGYTTLEYTYSKSQYPIWHLNLLGWVDTSTLKILPKNYFEQYNSKKLKIKAQDDFQ